MKRRETPHTDWCAQGHHCNLAEHRAHPIVVTVPGAGSLVLTRVRGPRGGQYAEVRLSVRLGTQDPTAAIQLAALLTDLDTLLRRAARRTPPRIRINDRAAVPPTPHNRIATRPPDRPLPIRASTPALPRGTTP